jgi:hypothetical protein
MANVTCELYCDSISTHIDQLYAGFTCLHREGLIRLKQSPLRSLKTTSRGLAHLHSARPAHLTAVLNRTIRIHYDTHDSWEIDEQALADSNWYFKRSFAPERLESYGPDRSRIRPLGLNYAVSADGPSTFALQRAWQVEKEFKRKVIALVRATALVDRFVFTPRVSTTHALPDLDAPPRILFMARAWDPMDDPQRPQKKMQERAELNETRANCIRLLRKEFGNSFFGGFAHNEFALKQYRDVLLPASQMAAQRNYLEMLRAYPICVATTGLHGSNGWKLAEYVCFSKAILSERLHYQVPGTFTAGRNYLEFRTADECAARAQELHDNRTLRTQLMLRNAEYYSLHLRPDVLVLNSLLVALGLNA